MLSPEQTLIRRLDNEIQSLKIENEKLRIYKKEVRASVVSLLESLLPLIPSVYRSEVRKQIAELEALRNE